MRRTGTVLSLCAALLTVGGTGALSPAGFGAGAAFAATAPAPAKPTAGAATATKPSPSKPVPAKPIGSSPPSAKRVRTHADARLYMTWNGAHGSPRAMAAIDAPCGDTTIVDTLYLSFDPGRDVADFLGVTATIYFHPAEGAQLPGYWKSGGGGIGGSPVRVDFSEDEERGFTTAWTKQALGGSSFDFVQTSGRLRFIQANAKNGGTQLKGGQVYGLARILVRRGAEGVDGCGSPTCIEWFSTGISYALNDTRDVNRGDRHVSINSPERAVCRPMLETAGIAPWKPPGK